MEGCPAGPRNDKGQSQYQVGQALFQEAIHHLSHFMGMTLFSLRIFLQKLLLFYSLSLQARQSKVRKESHFSKDHLGKQVAVTAATKWKKLKLET